MRYWLYQIVRTGLYFIVKVWNRLSVHGKENLPPRGTSFIIAANHASYLDPPIVGGCVWRNMSFVAKDRLFKIPIFGRIMRALQVEPVEGEEEVKTIRRLVRYLKSGLPVAIFPEGTRAGGGEMLKPQPGVAFLAKVAGVPIVPAYVYGTVAALPRGTRKYRPLKVRIFFGKPMDLPPKSSGISNKEYYEEVSVSVMGRILQLKQKAESVN